MDTRFATTTLPATANRLGVTLPASIVDSIDAYRTVRRTNPAPIPHGDIAGRVLDSAPRSRDKAFRDALIELTAESQRGTLVRALIAEAERRVVAAVREVRSDLVESFLTSEEVTRRASEVAEHAPRIPRLTPRSPSLDRTSPDVVMSVATVSSAWGFFETLVRDLSPLLPTARPTAPINVPALLFGIEYSTEAEARAVALAVSGAADGTVSQFVLGVPSKGVTPEQRERGLIIPAAALAALPNVTPGLVSTYAEYAARLQEFDAATTTGRWHEIVPQTHSESWAPNY